MTYFLIVALLGAGAPVEVKMNFKTHEQCMTTAAEIERVSEKHPGASIVSNGCWKT